MSDPAPVVSPAAAAGVGPILPYADLRDANLSGAYGYVRIHVSALVPLTTVTPPSVEAPSDGAEA